MLTSQPNRGRSEIFTKEIHREANTAVFKICPNIIVKVNYDD